MVVTIQVELQQRELDVEVSTLPPRTPPSRQAAYVVISVKRAETELSTCLNPATLARHPEKPTAHTFSFFWFSPLRPKAAAPPCPQAACDEGALRLLQRRATALPGGDCDPGQGRPGAGMPCLPCGSDRMGSSGWCGK